MNNPHDIHIAAGRLRAYLPMTPLVPLPELGAQVYAKLEHTQPTRSFKIRGALNALLELEAEQRQRGVIAASSGNHAQALSWAARALGISAVVMMPETTPATKVERSRQWGAEVRVLGANYDETEALARAAAQQEGRVYVSPYNDPHVVAGQGTMGLEICEQLPTVARVVVCAGGGGLVSGVGLALKDANPQVEVIAVCAQSAPALYNHLRGTAHPEVWETLAEALSGDIETGSITLEIAPRVVDEVVMVSEAQIAAAMRHLYQTHGWIVEGGGAVSAAAWMHGLIPADERPTVLIVSGGNVSEDKLKAL
ncbi:MAG: threonine/serine dehydratase [Anaerolineae bacterium]